MQEQTQHKAGIQQPAGLAKAEKKTGEQAESLTPPSLYPGLSEPKQLQEMANNSKQVTQLSRCQQLITKHNPVSKTAGVVQAMFLDPGNTAITTLAGLNTELAKLNDESGTLHPQNALSLSDFAGNLSATQLDNAIAKCQGKIRDYMSLKSEVIPMIHATITSMNQSATGAATTTGAGSGAAAAAATTTTAATSKTLAAFKFNDHSTWDVQPVDTSITGLSIDDMNLNDDVKNGISNASHAGRHSHGLPVIDTDYHEHALGGSGGIAFRYVRDKGTCKVTPTIYNYAEKRSDNQYHWKDAAKSSAPPGFPG